jgi:hypothetical protein
MLYSCFFFIILVVIQCIVPSTLYIDILPVYYCFWLGMFDLVIMEYMCHKCCSILMSIAIARLLHRVNLITDAIFELCILHKLLNVLKENCFHFPFLNWYIDFSRNCSPWFDVNSFLKYSCSINEKLKKCWFVWNQYILRYICLFTIAIVTNHILGISLNSSLTVFFFILLYI